MGADERAAAFRRANGSGAMPDDEGEAGAAQLPSARNPVSGRAMTPWTPTGAPADWAAPGDVFAGGAAPDRT
ncbi:hypothetical protein, partial [Frankia tisae]|uniref:hypothetical protein n=1 Tax=Frankia tisae TaxID=2950104 RepID=UPI0021BF8BB6